MSVEALRKAAALMRERAEAALDVRWDHIGGGRVSGWVDGYGEAAVCDARRKGDADHIASWDPAVALAVADLLDVWSREDLMSSKFTLPEERTCITDLVDAYLGGAS